MVRYGDIGGFSAPVEVTGSKNMRNVAANIVGKDAFFWKI
jgi:hypothetical protein